MSKEKLLLVDDEVEFVDALASRLEAKGFEIVKAFDGQDGIEKAHAQKPDLIIMDIMMPVMGGYDACRKLRLDKDFKDTPILMLTAKFEPNDIEFGKDMGADAYVTKPVELETLLHKVNALLRMKHIKADRIKNNGDAL